MKQSKSPPVFNYDTRTIADMRGQKSQSMAPYYSRNADLHEKLKPAVEKMEIAEKTRTKLSGKWW